MSTDFRSCPSCKAMVLADTYECPECGHAFDEEKSKQLTRTTAVEDLKSASLEEECRNCGAMVRSGLVRCWNCNAFMRDDIARRYQQISTTPQKIIYSDIPAEQRTDYLPPRVVAQSGKSRRGGSGTEDDFTLGGGVSTTAARPAADFVLDDNLLAAAPTLNVPGLSVPQVAAPNISVPDIQSPAAPAAAAPVAAPGQPAAPPTPGPNQPQSTTPGAAAPGTAAAPVTTVPAAAIAGDGVPAAAATAPTARTPGGADADDLLSIAMQEEEESEQKRGPGKAAKKKAAGPRTQILIPCPSCNSLVRTTDEYAGRKIRCPNCKSAVLIPPIVSAPPRFKRKAAKKDAKAEAPRIDVAWINDAWLHVFSPTSLVLKPGSMTDPHTMVDVAVTETGVFILSYGKETGKPAKTKGSAASPADNSEGGMLAFVRDKLLSLLGRGSSDATRAVDDLRDQWKKVREQVEKTGEFRNLPNADVRCISRDELAQLKLVQPIARAHESMFAGVPVFGEGRIALYLPLEDEEGRQTFLSLPLSLFRRLNVRLQSQFGLDLRAAENGVPDTESMETLSCFLDQTRFEAIRKLIYYQQDPEFGLELVGHRCTSCGATISEEGRRKKKLGGANGKGLAKAKCPKCSGKMGTDPLYKLVKTPEPAAAPAAASGDAAPQTA